jgi:predicted ATPase
LLGKGDVLLVGKSLDEVLEGLNDFFRHFRGAATCSRGHKLRVRKSLWANGCWFRGWTRSECEKKGKGDIGLVVR